MQFPKVHAAPLCWALSILTLATVAPPILAQPTEAAASSESASQLVPDDEVVETEADETAADGATEADATTETADLDDDEWLVDDEGRRYRVAEVPRIEGTYRLLEDDTKVRLPGGALLEVDSMTEETFWVRDYAPPAVKPPAVSIPNPARRERLRGDALDALLAEYDIALPTADQFRFEPFDAGLPKAGQWRNAFAVADMNADGHPDIVFGPARKGRSRPNIFLGDGKGNWAQWAEVEWPSAPYDYGAVAVGDLDGDGLLDLVFGIHLRGLVVLRNQGEGRFELWSDGVEVDQPGRGGDGSSFSSRSVAIHDWNADGKPDIVALGEGPKGLRKRARRGASRMIDTSRGLVVYINQGDGSWVGDLQESGTRPNFGDDFAFVDLDRTGALDLVLASQQMGVRHVLGVRTADGIERRVLDGVRSRGLIDSVEALDLDGDGENDFVLSYRARDRGQWFTGIDRFIRAEDGTWRREPLFAQPDHHGIHALRSGDIDGDGRVDLVAADGDGQLRVFLGTADGFRVEESPELPEFQRGCVGYDVRLADLDGDGTDEVVATFAGEKTGMPGLARLSNPGCANEGGIYVWKVASSATEEPDAGPVGDASSD